MLFFRFCFREEKCTKHKVYSTPSRKPQSELYNSLDLCYNIFIIFKLIRHSRSFRVIGKALASVKEELETAYTASFITICFSAILMYYIERSAQPEVFENIGDGIWWAIITFATVGYGDIYPITPLGKLLGCIICLVGVAMVAIPTGIISSSFINIVQKKEKKQGEDCNNESNKQ